MPPKRKPNSLEGYCFTITGKLSMTRKDFEDLIISNGGEISKTITSKCTHLIR